MYLWLDSILKVSSNLNESMILFIGLHAAFCFWGLVLLEKGRGYESPTVIPTENIGVADRKGDVGEPSRMKTELELEVTCDFSVGKTEPYGS